jgi:hypothetical protein
MLSFSHSPHQLTHQIAQLNDLLTTLKPSYMCCQNSIHCKIDELSQQISNGNMVDPFIPKPYSPLSSNIISHISRFQLEVPCHQIFPKNLTEADIVFQIYEKKKSRRRKEIKILEMSI